MSKNRFRETVFKVFVKAHVPNSFFFGGGVAGLKDFACVTLPTTPLDFQGKGRIIFSMCEGDVIFLQR